MKKVYLVSFFIVLLLLYLIYLLYLPYKYYQRDIVKEETRAVKNVEWFLNALNRSDVVTTEEAKKYLAEDFELYLASRDSVYAKTKKGSLTINMLQNNKDLFDVFINKSSMKIYLVQTKLSNVNDNIINAVMATDGKAFLPLKGLLGSYKPNVIIFPLTKISKKILLLEIIINGKPLTELLGIKLTDEAHPHYPKLRRWGFDLGTDSKMEGPRGTD